MLCACTHDQQRVGDFGGNEPKCRSCCGASLRAARLPARKTLSQFDWRRAHGLERARIEDLARCSWIPAARNVVLVNPVGTGKTHVVIALGIEAIEHCHNVLFYRASDLVRTPT